MNEERETWLVEQEALSAAAATILATDPQPALFLGAGAAVSSGGRSASSVAGQILRQYYGLHDDVEVSRRFQREHHQAVSFENVLDALGRTVTQQRSLILPSFGQMKPSNGYSCLATLVLAGYFNQVLLTTNFDTMLEEALAAEIERGGWQHSLRVLLSEDLTAGPVGAENEIIVLKLHGSLDRKDRPLRMTMEQTATLPGKVQDLVADLFQKAGFVVVGYRLKDIGVRNALETVGTSAGSLYWVLPDEATDADAESSWLLRRHGFRQQIVRSDFDTFFESMARGLPQLLSRRMHRERFDRAWAHLERASSFGAQRRRLLDGLLTEALELVDVAANDEARALLEFVSYQRQPRGESYRLEHGITLLSEAVDAYNRFRRILQHDETRVVEFALLTAMRDLYLVAAAGGGERHNYLSRLIARGEHLLERAGSDSLWRARC